MIPANRLNPAAFKMLQNYTPQPNMDNGMMGAMTMMGTPTVLGNMFHYTENNGVNDIVDALGITGVNFGGQGAWGAPSFNVQGYSPFRDAWLATPMHMWDTMLEGRETLNWQKGAHSLKFGGSYRWYIWPMWALVQSRGYYTFTNGFTTQTATNDGTGDALASFLLGLPATRQVQNGVPTMDLRQWSADAFVQDTWRVTPHTTIDAGVRYEFMAPLVDTSRHWSNLYQTSTGLAAFIGGESGMSRGLMYRTSCVSRRGSA